jgi:nucleotide-binding universal stress UspA family protein
VQLIQEEGDPFIEIIEYAKKHDQDLIVMGTSRRTWFKQIMIGSVTEKVVRYSPVSVLVVKHKKIK